MRENVHKISVDRQLHIQQLFGDFLQRQLGEVLKIGQHLNRRLQALGWPEAAGALDLAVKQGKSTSGEKSFPSPALELHWLVEPLIEGESVSGAVLSITDITREKRLLRQQELGTKMAIIAQFAHQVATRFNNPLSAILNQIGCLLVEDESGHGHKELAGIQQQIYDLSLVTNALDLFIPAENSSGKLVQLNAILEKSAEVVQLLTAQKGVHLSLSLAPEQSIIYANEIVLEQCLLNLLQNAIEFSPDGGEVVIRSEKSDGLAMISIQDNGPGIPPGELERVFEPFYSTRSADHLGLGLTISYCLAARYRGFLELESAPGAGTTARLLFPIAKSLIKKG